MSVVLDRYRHELAALLAHVSDRAGAQARWKDDDLVLRQAMPPALRVHANPFCRAMQRARPRECFTHCRPDGAWWRRRSFAAHWRTCHAGVREYTFAGRDEDGNFLGTASIGPFFDPTVTTSARGARPPPAAAEAHVLAAARLFSDGLRWLMPLRDDARVGVRQLVNGPPQVQAMLERLRLDPRRDLSLTAMARAVGLSPTRLTHLCRAATGRSFTAWRQEAVLARARQLLAGGDLPIAVIAERCGYANPGHFAAAFRRAYGLGPLAFRTRSAQPDAV